MAQLIKHDLSQQQKVGTIQDTQLAFPKFLEFLDVVSSHACVMHRTE